MRVRDAGQRFLQTLTRPTAADAACSAVSRYTAMVLGFLGSVVAARLLGPADYGVAVLVMSYPTLVWSLCSLKSVSVTTRYTAAFYAADRTEELKALCKLVYGIDLLVGMAAFGLVGATAWWAARHALNAPQMAWLMLGYAASFPLAAFNETSVAVLSAMQKFRWLALSYVIDRLLQLLAVVGAVYFGYGVPGMVLGTAAAQAAQGITMLVWATYLLHRDGLGFWWNASCRAIAPLRKELSTLLGWNFLAVTLTGLREQLPLLLLGRYGGPEVAAFYRLAANLTCASTHIESSLGQVVYPRLSTRWRGGERRGLHGTLRGWTVRGGLPAGALVLMGTALLPLIVPVALGSSYGPMVRGTQMMMSGAAVGAIFFWLTPFYYAAGRFDLWTKVSAVHVAVSLAIGLLGLHQWGFSGLAASIGMTKVLFTGYMANTALSTGMRWK